MLLDLESRQLQGPGLRVLNRGGFANADVLLVSRRAGPPVIVKDYGRRSAFVRWALAPWLLRHELKMLARVEGLPGVPHPLGRVGELALAMEYVDGRPLRRRSHARALPAAFFDALDGILDGLAARGVSHLDLRSPTNVLCTSTLAPALVDLMSAFAAPGLSSLLLPLERRALRKLRARFEAPTLLGAPTGPPSDASASRRPTGEEEVAQIRVGPLRRRLHYREAGPLSDPVPALLIPDAGLSHVQLLPVLEQAPSAERRALALDLPGFGGSTRGGRGGSFSGRGIEAAARSLVAFLDALRILRVDLVGIGWGGLVARTFATRSPSRCRSLLTLDAPAERMTGPFRDRWQAARLGVRALRERLLDELPDRIDPIQRNRLAGLLAGPSGSAAVRAYRSVRLGRVPFPPHPWLFATSDAAAPEPPELRLRAPGARFARWPTPAPERIWSALHHLAALEATPTTDKRGHADS